VKFLKFQELGNVNEAFENEPGEKDRSSKYSTSNGVRTFTSTDEKETWYLL